MIGDVVFYPSYFHYKAFSVSAEPSVQGQGYACSGAETTGAAYDLVDSRRTNVITVDTNGEATDFYFEMDTTATITGANYMILDNHNCFSAAAQAIARYTATPTIITITSAYSGTIQTALTAQTVSSNVITFDRNGILLINFAALAASDIWHIYFQDLNASNFEADVTAGEWYTGVKCTPSVAPDINIQEGYRSEGIIVERSRGGVRYGFENYGSRRVWQLSWKHLTSTDKTNIETLWQVTDGPKYPFYFDSGENATPTLYLMRFAQNDLVFNKQGSSSYSLTLKLESET